VNIEEINKNFSIISDSSSPSEKIYSHNNRLINTCISRQKKISQFGFELLEIVDQEYKIIEEEIYSSSGNGFVRTSVIEDYLREVLLF
jgi:hypothetical protein